MSGGPCETSIWTAAGASSSEGSSSSAGSPSSVGCELLAVSFCAFESVATAGRGGAATSERPNRTMLKITRKQAHFAVDITRPLLSANIIGVYSALLIKGFQQLLRYKTQPLLCS